MMVIAVNDAMKQIDKETEKMLGAYGSQLNGLF
jgi:DNA-binding protein YbaB